MIDISMVILCSFLKASLKVKLLLVCVLLLEVLDVHWFDHEVQCGGEGHEAGHGVHRVIVQEGRGVHGPRWHNRHQLGDGQGLGLVRGNKYGGLVTLRITSINEGASAIETPNLDKNS